MANIEVGNWFEAPREEIRPGAERVLIDVDSKNLLCQFVEVQYGSVGKEHSHPHEQISIILKGSCDYFVDGVPHHLTAGSWIVDPPNAMHYSIPTDPTQTVWILDVFSPTRPEFIQAYKKAIAKTEE